MKIIQLKPCAGAAVRRAGFNMEQCLVIPLVGAMLFAVAGCRPAAAAGGPTYKLFGREIGGYSSKDDVPAIVTKELGPKASVAEWEEIKKQFGQSEASLKAFCEKVGLAPKARHVSRSAGSASGRAARDSTSFTARTTKSPTTSWCTTSCRTSSCCLARG